MEKVETEELFDILLEQSIDDWSELCAKCSELIEEAKMSNEDIDKIIERVKEIDRIR